MSWAEKELREAFRSSLAVSRGPQDNASAAADNTPARDCPSAETIWDAMTLELAPEQRRSVISHTALCADCAMVWQAALGVTQAKEAATTPSNAPANEPSSGWLQSLLGPLLKPSAAGPVFGGVAALLVAFVWLNQSPEMPALDAPAASGILRGAEGPGPSLQTHAPRLSPGDRLGWDAVADAEGYRITLMDSSGSTLDFLVNEPTLQLNNALLERFTAGEALLWSVEVVGGQSNGARSASQTFTLE